MGNNIGSRDVYTVSISLQMYEPYLIWVAAAQKARDVYKMPVGDVVETLGPMDDPDVKSCIAMLAGPPSVSGCVLDTYAIL